jgi:hypothetical protein
MPAYKFLAALPRELICVAGAVPNMLAAIQEKAGRRLMQNTWSRRSWMKGTLAVPLVSVSGWPLPRRAPLPDGHASGDPVSDTFPTQAPELVREMVTVAHFNLSRVKELVEARPSLAKASWDWGFGDWECALGAASHMGNRPIAEYLLSKGARPSLFSSAMLGHLDIVKAFIAAQPEVQRIRGPHSISLLAHAKAGGGQARAVFDFLQSVGSADADPDVPLSEADANALKGAYVFGISMNQVIEIAFERGGLTWTRKGVMGRPLVYLGDRAFYPVGAPSVRIQFAGDEKSMAMTVSDPQPVLVARKK